MDKGNIWSQLMRYGENGDKGSNDEQMVQTGTFEPDGISGFVVSTEVTAVQFRTHTHNEIEIVLETYKDGPVLETKQTEDTLEISASDPDSSSLFKNIPATKLTVLVPSRLWNRLSIVTEIGEIAISDMNVSDLGVRTHSGELALEEVKLAEGDLKTMSGEVSIRNIETESFSCASSSGKVFIGDFKGNLYGRTQSGPMIVRRLQGEELDIRNRSGGMQIQDVKVKNTSIRTASGDIDVEKLDARDTRFQSHGGEARFRYLSGDIRGKTVSGEVELNVADVGRNIQVETKSGDIRLRRAEKVWNSDFRLHTISGIVNVEADVRDKKVREKDRFEGIAGSGDGMIDLKSDSGDIHLL